MEGRPPPNAVSGSPPDILENHFAGLNIGTRKKEAQGRMHSKEEGDLVEDDVFQDINVLDQWKSLDKISFDDTESSEWERSNSSSLSWFDESEQETTLKVKSMMDNIEKALYGETHSPLPRLTAEECQQWRFRFPHLRVVGKAVEINCVEVPKTINSLQVNECEETDRNHTSPCNDDEFHVKEDYEETYVSHGTIEHEPLLPHEFQQANELLMDNESKAIQEALVEELTKHVWKEVVEPKIKVFMEEHSKKKEGESANISRFSEACVTESPRILEKHVKGKLLSTSDTQIQLPQSARELGYAVASSSSNSESFHRRHSDHISLSHRKFKNRLTPGRISEEKDEGDDMVTTKPENYWSVLEAENRIGFNPRMPETNGLPADAITRSSLLEEQLHFPSPSYLRTTEVSEKLKHRLKSGISYSQRSKIGKIKYSEENFPQNKSRDVRLPAIEDNKWSANSQASKSQYGRSSSALPKLAPRTLRPTMSSYKTLYGERTASVMKHPPFKCEISPVKGNMDACNHKMNGSRQSTTISARKVKLQKEKYSDL